jgi:hypothetical protein
MCVCGVENDSHYHFFLTLIIILKIFPLQEVCQKIFT